MIQRFQIEDLVVQDSSGVIFRALDTETHQTVAIRRFFPFGPTGGGLDEREQVDFIGTLGRLSEINHPALRAIICGGCDPVDGMPYIATEWIEGRSLRTLLMNRTLSEEETTLVLDQAMQVCQALSEVLGLEGVWVETDTHAIIIGDRETQRPVSFWISPLIWTERRDNPAGLEPFISLTNAAMGWSGKQTRGLPATGPGAWVKWLHDSARTATLREARERLAAATGTAAPQPTQRVVRQAARPVLAGKKKPASKAPAWILASTALLATGLGGWMMVRRNAALHADAKETGIPAVETVSPASPGPPPTSPSTEPEAVPPVTDLAPAVSKVAADPGESREERANRLAAELTAAARKAGEKKPAGLKQKAGPRTGVFSPADHDLLVPLSQKNATVEGTLASIGYSSSKKTMYLIFAGNRDAADFRGAIAAKDATGELSESALGSLMGKKIRIAGKIRLESVGTRNRPVVDIGNRAGIEIAE